MGMIIDNKISKPIQVVPTGSNHRNMLTIFAALTCLACLVVLVLAVASRASHEWNKGLSLQYTVELKPRADISTQQQLESALIILNSEESIAQVKPLSQQDLKGLMAPWLGTQVNIDALPLSQLISITLKSEYGHNPSVIDHLSAQLQQVAGASLEAYHTTQKEYQTAAHTVHITCMIIIVLLLIIMAAIVGLSTRANVIDNQHIISTLQLVGAESNYIGSLLQKTALGWSFKGTGIGILLAMLCITIISLVAQLRGLDSLFIFLELIPDWRNIMFIAFIPMITLFVTWLTAKLTLQQLLKEAIC